MKHLFILAAAILISSAPAAAQIEKMLLKGQGEIKFLGFIKVYDAYLYASHTVTEQNFLAPEISKCLKIEYDVAFTKEDFIEGANTVLLQQHSKEKVESLQFEIEQLHNSYQPVSEGDTYTLCYDANSAKTTLSLNSKALTTITSEEFSTLYFGIWLGEHNPIDEALRDNLLSTTQ